MIVPLIIVGLLCVLLMTMVDAAIAAYQHRIPETAAIAISGVLGIAAFIAILYAADVL